MQLLYGCISYLNNIFIFNFPGLSQVPSGAIAGGVIASVVVILLCIGVAVFAIVYIQQRKKYSNYSGKVEITRYGSL